MSILKNGKVGFGVIGCRLGREHIESALLNPAMELNAICDIDKQRMESLAKIHGIDEKNCYTDYLKLIERDDIDAVVVATPDMLHEEQAVAAMKAGKHVLCEKPMALSIDECKRMIQASKDTGKKLMIGQVVRYTPGAVLAKKLIDDGEIGELFYVESEYAHDYLKARGAGDWRVDPRRHPFIGGGCHAVDLLRWIAGNPYEVFAYANHKVLKSWPVDDCTVSIMKFPNNVIGKVFVSIGCKRRYTMRTVLYGDRGTIILDTLLPYITIFRDTLPDPIYGNVPQTAQTIPVQLDVPVITHNISAEMEEFADILLNGKEVLTDGIQGASTVSACIAVVQSANTGEKAFPVYDFSK